MMNQLELAFRPLDSQVTECEAPRLSRQCAAILALLRQGPATNRQLADLSLKYTSRISEVRAALKPHGETVIVLERNRETGLVLYGLASVHQKGDGHANSE